MANKADGSVIIKANVDIDKAEKDLERLKKKIVQTEKEIEKMGTARTGFAQKSAELAASLDEAKAKLYSMKQASAGAFSSEQISEQAETVKSLQKQYDSVQAKVESYDRKIASAAARLDEQTVEAGQLAKEINSVSAASRSAARAQEKAAKSAKKFGLRLREVIRSALVFTLITQTLAKFRDWFGKVLKTSTEAQASFAKLKGALLTLAQPLVDVLVPALVLLTNLLTAIIGRLAQFTTALSGTSVSAASKAAKALNEEAEAVEGVGDAAKGSAKSLAGFDEINKLSDNSGEDTSTTAPDFTWSEGISEKMQEIADAVILIGIGLATWKISADFLATLEGLTGKFAKIGTTIGNIGIKIAGIAIAVAGLMLLWNGFSDAMTNGLDWGNIATMIGGVTLAAIGLGLAFGTIGAGIALVVGSIALLIAGFNDISQNGMTTKNVLTVIAGLLAGGLGIALLVGSWLPLIIAAIAAVLLAIVQFTGNGEKLLQGFKDFFGGLIDFVVNLINGDLDAAFEGLKRAFKGLVNIILTLAGSVVNALIKGLNWLIGKINTISFTVPDWVPLIGGSSVGFNLPKVSEWKIPQLATGAVIPPNREFLAVLGDQRSGNNIEAPESLIRKIVREEAGGMNTQLLQEILQAIKDGGVIVLDGQKVSKRVVHHINNMTAAAGESVLLL
jgi:hypothetical protein